MTDVSLVDIELSQRARDRVDAVLESGYLADGPEVRRFEEAFADYCGVTHAVGTSNGTTALVAALEALGLGDGDAVITSPFSFVASANAIRHAGGTPVFADIDPETYALDPESVESVLDRRSDVVGLLPVHLYGLPAAMPTLLDIADRENLFVLEDACQSHGASVNGTRVGALGDAGCFSFYPTKNMTTGEGGMITTDDEGIAERAAAYINHGRRADGNGSYSHAELGHNHRMTSVAAAIGRVQLERLPEFTAARRANAQWYDDHLNELPVETPTVPRGRRHVYHQYTIRVDDRDALRETLSAREIGTGIYYPTPIHRQPAYESLSTAVADRPHAERAAASVLSLPVHPNLTPPEREAVVAAIAAHYDSAADHGREDHDTGHEQNPGNAHAHAHDSKPDHEYDSP